IKPSRSELHEYVDSVTTLLLDSQRRRRMGKAARQRVSAYFSLDRGFTAFRKALWADGSTRVTAGALLPAGIALELATNAVEYNRVCNALEFYWTRFQQGASITSSAP